MTPSYRGCAVEAPRRTQAKQRLAVCKSPTRTALSPPSSVGWVGGEVAADNSPALAIRNTRHPISYSSLLYTILPRLEPKGLIKSTCT